MESQIKLRQEALTKQTKEHERAVQILALCEFARMEFAAKGFIRKGLTVEQARKELCALVLEKSPIVRICMRVAADFERQQIQKLSIQEWLNRIPVKGNG